MEYWEEVYATKMEAKRKQKQESKEYWENQKKIEGEREIIDFMERSVEQRSNQKSQSSNAKQIEQRSTQDVQSESEESSSTETIEECYRRKRLNKWKKDGASATEQRSNQKSQSSNATSIEQRSKQKVECDGELKITSIEQRSKQKEEGQKDTGLSSNVLSRKKKATEEQNISSSTEVPIEQRSKPEKGIRGFVTKAINAIFRNPKEGPERASMAKASKEEQEPDEVFYEYCGNCKKWYRGEDKAFKRPANKNLANNWGEPNEGEFLTHSESQATYKCQQCNQKWRCSGGRVDEEVFGISNAMNAVIKVKKGAQVVYKSSNELSTGCRAGPKLKWQKDAERYEKVISGTTTAEAIFWYDPTSIHNGAHKLYKEEGQPTWICAMISGTDLTCKTSGSCLRYHIKLQDIIGHNAEAAEMINGLRDTVRTGTAERSLIMDPKEIAVHVVNMWKNKNFRREWQQFTQLHPSTIKKSEKWEIR